jgi:transmembrane sensor
MTGMKERYDIKSITDKYIKVKCTAEELEEAMILFSDSYQNPELRPTLFEYWMEEEKCDNAIIPDEDLTVILDKVHHRINLAQDQKSISRIRKLVFNVSRIAALIILGLLLGLSVHHLKKTEPVYFTSIAPKGSVSQMVLPDNSIVYLNAGSQLKYTVEGVKEKREVFLEGEAWFDVSKNEKKPFVVHTRFYDVIVLGTQFNVKAYKTDKEIITTLEEGLIQVTSSENLKMAENTILKPGEQLVYHTLKKAIEVKKVDTRMFTAWKDNKLIFINMNLKELFVVLERKYGVDIRVTNNIILDYHYDGTIKDETILEVLDLLKETLPVKYTIEGQTILITKK